MLFSDVEVIDITFSIEPESDTLTIEVDTNDYPYISAEIDYDLLTIIVDGPQAFDFSEGQDFSDSMPIYVNG